MRAANEEKVETWVEWQSIQKVKQAGASISLVATHNLADKRRPATNKLPRQMGCLVKVPTRLSAALFSIF